MSRRRCNALLVAIGCAAVVTLGVMLGSLHGRDGGAGDAFPAVPAVWYSTGRAVVVPAVADLPTRSGHGSVAA